MNTLLFELGTEELPASMIGPALQRLALAFQELLAENQVARADVRCFSTPRRLAVLIEGLPDHQPDREEQISGPPQSVGLDEEGGFTPAALGFARKMGVEPEALFVVEEERGSYLACRRKIKGLAVPELFRSSLTDVIASIPWPKSMYWRESRFRFARPIRWIVLLWNSEALDFEFEGLSAARQSWGHRFQGGQVEVPEASQYVEVLRNAGVIVDPKKRRQIIEGQLAEKAGSGLEVLADADLLETVVQLNELPSVVRGDFKREFLEIPREVLLTVMRYHQKYFGVVDSEGGLQPHFLAVINTDADSDGRIRTGHERVLQARLEDAAFFWEKDRKKSLEERLPLLEKMLYQRDLGSYLEKTRRVESICSELAADPHLATAARLAKTDLTTEMVFELPELQGSMGGLYAQSEGQPVEVWQAIYDQYKPVSMEASCPQGLNGALLSVADRIDTIVGCFSVGILPRGARDPFGLRRQAQGLIRILLEHDLQHRLEDLVEIALGNLQVEAGVPEEVKEKALGFLEGRVRFVLGGLGLDFDVLNAVMHRGAGIVSETHRKGVALSQIRSEEDFERLAGAFKRIRNILADQAVSAEGPDVDVFEMEAERLLHAACSEVAIEIRGDLDKSDFLTALKGMATLRAPVDRFFDEVMVMDEDEGLRNNRLRLLNEIATMFLEVADISQIVRKD